MGAWRLTGRTWQRSLEPRRSIAKFSPVSTQGYPFQEHQQVACSLSRRVCVWTTVCSKAAMCAHSTQCRGSGGHEVFAYRVVVCRLESRLPGCREGMYLRASVRLEKTSEKNLLCAGIHHIVLWTRTAAPLLRIPGHVSTDTSGAPPVAMSKVVSGLRCIAMAGSAS